MTSTSQHASPSGSHKKRNVIIIVCVVLVLALAGGLLWWFIGRPAFNDQLEPNAVVGTMPGKTDEQIEEELNRKVDEKTIAFVLNSEPVYADGRAKGTIMFENPASNGKRTRLELYRDDTNELIYKTGLLDPGSYVPEAKLDKFLEKGNYDCTAYIYAYKLNTEEYLGKVAAGVTVHVVE